MPNVRLKRTRDRLRRNSQTTDGPAVVTSSLCLPDTDYEKAGIAASPSSNMPDTGDVIGLVAGTDTTFV